VTDSTDRLADKERARDLELIVNAMRASVAYHGKAIAFFVLLAIFTGTVAVVREIYWLAVVGFGLFGGLASLAFFMTGKSDPDRSPVLRAIRSTPDQVAEVKCPSPLLPRCQGRRPGIRALARFPGDLRDGVHEEGPGGGGQVVA